jgi:hypothetical protein
LFTLAIGWQTWKVAAHPWSQRRAADRLSVAEPLVNRRVLRLNADFLKACRSLATVGCWLVAAIRQLKVAEQQVGVATDTAK